MSEQSAMRWRPVRPWQHWRFALTVTFCWLARKHFPHLDRTSDRGYRWYTCRVCRSHIVDTRSRRATQPPQPAERVQGEAGEVAE